MKKPLLIVLTLAMLLSLCACGGSNDTPTSNVEDSSTTQTTDAPEQEAQNNETTSSENTPSEEAPAETDKAEEEASLWETYYYVDDFNQPTEDWYICNSTSFLGTFSNSAVSDANLFVDMVVDEVDIAFFLYEYGNNLVKNSSSSYDDLYNITMRTADGTDLSFTGTMFCGDDRIFIDPDFIPQVVSALSQEGNTMTSFYIENAERTVNNYLFTVISNNFAEQYNALMG